MTLRLNGTTGYVELEAPATAGSNTLVLPTGNGANGQVLSTNGSGALSWADRMTAAGPAFMAYRNSNQSVTNAAFNKVQIDAEGFDTANCFDTSNNRFTPTTAGYYFVDGSVNIENSSGTRIRVISALSVNGGIIARGSDVFVGTGVVAGSYQSVVSRLVYCNGSTDYVELYAWTEASTTAVITGGSLLTYFQAYLARPA